MRIPEKPLHAVYIFKSVMLSPAFIGKECAIWLYTALDGVTVFQVLAPRCSCVRVSIHLKVENRCGLR